MYSLPFHVYHHIRSVAQYLTRMFCKREGRGFVSYTVGNFSFCNSRFLCVSRNSTRSLRRKSIINLANNLFPPGYYINLFVHLSFHDPLFCTQEPKWDHNQVRHHASFVVVHLPSMNNSYFYFLQKLSILHVFHSR